MLETFQICPPGTFEMFNSLLLLLSLFFKVFLCFCFVFLKQGFSIVAPTWSWPLVQPCGNPPLYFMYICWCSMLPECYATGYQSEKNSISNTILHVAFYNIKGELYPSRGPSACEHEIVSLPEYIKVFLTTEYLKKKRNKELERRLGMPEDSSESWFLVASYPGKTGLK